MEYLKTSFILLSRLIKDIIIIFLFITSIFRQTTYFFDKRHNFYCLQENFHQKPAIFIPIFDAPAVLFNHQPYIVAAQTMMLFCF